MCSTKLTFFATNAIICSYGGDRMNSIDELLEIEELIAKINMILEKLKGEENNA
jgi:hypothetical protein